MIDLDHFKTINDSAGHAAGDAVLRQLRDLLKSCSRTSDIIVRWGGDEFLLVARDLSGDGLLELAERVRTRVAQHVFEIGEGRVVRTTCSIGFACYPFFREQLDALSWEQVISVADRALYVAKASGRNAWVGLPPRHHRASDPGPVQRHLPRHPAARPRGHAARDQLAHRPAQPGVGSAGQQERVG